MAEGGKPMKWNRRMIREDSIPGRRVIRTAMGMPAWLRASWLLSLALLLALAGCKSAQQDGVVEAGASDDFTIAEDVRPPTQVDDARKLFTPAPNIKRYKVLAGKPEGGVVETRTIAAPKGGAAVKPGDAAKPAAGLPPLDGVGYTHPIPLKENVRFLRFTPGGRIEHLGWDDKLGAVMIAVEDLNETPIATVTYYDPPLPYLPIDLKPGVESKLQSKLSIRKRSNLDSELDSGLIDKSVWHVADVSLHWTGGASGTGGKPLELTCRRIKSQFTLSLKLAKVSGLILEDYHPTHGVVREEWEENVRAFLFGWQTKRTMIWNGRIDP